jgi:hypothetical protein
VVKGKASRLTEGRSAADDGIFRERPGRARIAPFSSDVLGGFSAPEQAYRVRVRSHAVPHVLNAGHLPAS